MSVVVSEVQSRRELAEFVRLPWQINRDNPAWIAPLLRDCWQWTDARRSRLLAAGPHALWVARRKGAGGTGAVVGRVAAGIDRRNTAMPGRAGLGYFTLFECADDAEAARALLHVACEFVARQGASVIRGPISPVEGDTNRGVLVEGFANRPVWGQAHNLPYYDRLVTGAGFEKGTDFHSRRVRIASLPRREEAVARAMEQYGFATYPLDRRRFRQEIEEVHDVMARAYVDDWVDLSPPHFEDTWDFARQLRYLVPPELIRIARLGGPRGPAIGFSGSLPDYNQVLGHFNGNLANVLAWPRALAAYRRIDTIRLMLLFVVPEHRRQGVPAALYLDTIKAALARDYTWAVGSNYDEANAAVSREAARIGGETYAVLRIYERQVGPLSRAQGRVG